ncbi:hypothetical protein EVAR_41515_1 [Eumeta japonica]|uniref:Uncharacterized protein n=1 Tax=Eumeta variegata TaxID=151549 RepID=A0A4C1X297_EUMVA|nr:hypothetical protein EVAR_41515_1 [Eumeta japonica]
MRRKFSLADYSSAGFCGSVRPPYTGPKLKLSADVESDTEKGHRRGIGTGTAIETKVPYFNRRKIYFMFTNRRRIKYKNKTVNSNACPDARKCAKFNVV